MNVYKITTTKEWNPEPTYHIGNRITDVFRNVNDEYIEAIIVVEKIDEVRRMWEADHYKLPATITG